MRHFFPFDRASFHTTSLARGVPELRRARLSSPRPPRPAPSAPICRSSLCCGRAMRCAKSASAPSCSNDYSPLQTGRERPLCRRALHRGRSFAAGQIQPMPTATAPGTNGMRCSTGGAAGPRAGWLAEDNGSNSSSAFEAAADRSRAAKRMSWSWGPQAATGGPKRWQVSALNRKPSVICAAAQGELPHPPQMAPSCSS